MRYLRQYTKKDCGPVACLNILKYIGQRATYQDIYRIRREVGHSSYFGVFAKGVEIWLDKNNINHECIVCPKISIIKKALCSHHIVLAQTCYIDYDAKKYHKHFSLLIDYEYGKTKPYKAINYYSQQTYSNVSYQSLKLDLSKKTRYNPYDDNPNIWIIRKDNV